MTGPPRRVVVTDANVLINLMHVSRLVFLGKIPDHTFVVPDHVREEITNSEQRAAIDAAVQDGWLTIEAITDLDILSDFTELIGRLGRGESACIAIAAQKCCYIASDEKRRFLREATARVGADRILTTVDVFVLAIRAGLVSVVEADADKAVLEGRRFKMPFSSFAEVLK